MALYTNNMRFTGLSGIDTETMVFQLMKAESYKLNRLYQSRQKILWQQESYRNVAASVRTFEKSVLNISAANSLMMPSTYRQFTSSVKMDGSDTSAVRVTSTSGAAAGDFRVEVENLASKEIFRGATIYGKMTGEAMSGSFADGDGFNLTVDGVTKKITFDSSDAAVMNGGSDTAKQNLLNTKLQDAFGMGTDPATGTLKQRVTVSVAAGEISLTATAGGRATITGEAGVLENLGFTSGMNTDHIADSKKLGDIFGVSGTIGTINGVAITEDTTLGQLKAEINKTNGSLLYDATSRSFRIEAKNTGPANAVNLSGLDSNLRSFITDKLEVSLVANSSNAKYTEPLAAKYKINGVTYWSDTNDVQFNNVSMTLLQATGGKEAIVTIARDTARLLDTIKNFVEGYNKMIDSIFGETNTRRPKKDEYNYYEPLTDDQKEAMKDRDIDLWEEKARKGLLYNDPLLSDFANQMRWWLYEPVKLRDGRELNLVEFGITTSSNYWEHGKLVIDEAKLTAALENRLDDVEKLFTNDSDIGFNRGRNNPARLRQLGIAERMNDIIENAIGTRGTISEKAGIVGTLTEATSTMQSELRLQSDRINDMIRALQRKENSYYAMFAKMEQAIQANNNQMAYLQMQLGMY